MTITFIIILRFVQCNHFVPGAVQFAAQSIALMQLWWIIHLGKVLYNTGPKHPYYPFYFFPSRHSSTPPRPSGDSIRAMFGKIPENSVWTMEVCSDDRGKVVPYPKTQIQASYVQSSTLSVEVQS